MKLTYFESGDKSVGIGNIEEEIEFGEFLSEGLDNLCEEDRDKFRLELAKLLREWLGEPNAQSNILFNDECFDCQTKLTNGKCKEKTCLQNLRGGRK